jgi:Tol biopolymer transport system component
LRNVVAGAQLKWSPNSRYLTYVGARDANRAVNIIDITSGVEKPLVSGTQTISRDLAWRTDGRSILYSRITSFGASPALNDLEIREVTVDGKDKLIRSIPHEALSNGNGPTGIRLSDSVAVSIGSSGVWAVPYSGGPARQLLKGQTTRTVFTPDGRALVHGIEPTPDQGIKALQLLGLDGQVIRTVRLPFTGFVTAFDRIIPLTPDGRAAVIVGRDAGSSSAKIYRVPLDGAAPTPIADLTDKAASQIDVSPDGRSILYTAIGPEASSFVLVDLTDALKRLSRSH